jgi:curved DNA-binding protein CbpA
VTRDPYQTIGISKSASEAEVKKAYRRRAKELHPDRNINDPKAQERFSELNSAYEIIGDATKRQQFDRGEIDGKANPASRALKVSAAADVANPLAAAGLPALTPPISSAKCSVRPCAVDRAGRSVAGPDRQKARM